MRYLHHQSFLRAAILLLLVSIFHAQNLSKNTVNPLISAPLKPKNFNKRPRCLLLEIQQFTGGITSLING